MNEIHAVKKNCAAVKSKNQNTQKKKKQQKE